MRYVNFLIALCFVTGVVDQVHGENVHAELTSRDGSSQAVDLPLFLFPCQVTEGDVFYFTKTSGVFELRCGEPPLE